MSQSSSYTTRSGRSVNPPRPIVASSSTQTPIPDSVPQPDNTDPLVQTDEPPTHLNLPMADAQPPPSARSGSPSGSDDSRSSSDVSGPAEVFVDPRDFKNARLNLKHLEYDGSREHYTRWRNTLDLHLATNANQFPTNQSKIAFALLS